MRFFIFIFGTLSLLTLAFAERYVVQPGDTLYALARSRGTTIAEIQRLNNLKTTDLRIGQILELPTKSIGGEGSTKATLQTVRSGKLTLTVSTWAVPGEAVTLRLNGSTTAPGTTAPTMRWNNEVLVVARDQNTWVGVGRALLGTPPQTITLTVKTDATTLQAKLALRAASQPVITLQLPASRIAQLTDTNRSIENKILGAAYVRRGPQLWTMPFTAPIKLKGATTSAFGSARRYGPGQPILFHYGEDFQARSGTPIVAANDGVIVVRGLYKIRGGLIGIDHGAGVVSLYFHLSKFNVKLGDSVKRGQVIGFVGSTGLSTGPHLHWEMRVRGEATNPVQWVGKRWP